MLSKQYIPPKGNRIVKYLSLCLPGVCLIALGLHSSVCAAQHAVLLPAPREIHYASGSLPIRNLSIKLLHGTNTEDNFAASELKREISQKTGLDLSTQAPSAPTIVLDRTGASDPLPLPGEKPGPDSREAYHLTINAKGVTISGRSSAAVYYGVQTLLQLVQGSGPTASLPYVTINDWPSLAYRGTLVDVGSEGPMTTFDEVKKQLDFMARWKANQYFFYSEGNIELDGYPLLNPNARFTKQQIRDLIAYARQRHIDVVPAVELYGHLHDLFRIEKYSALSDFPHGGEFNAADPKIKAVLQDWTTQLSDLFPSPFVDIGFDETWSIQNASVQAGADATPVKLFLQQLSTTAALFQQHGKQVMAYADIMVKFPGIVAKLPPGIIALPWWYDPSPDPEYKKWIDPLVQQHIPFLVIPGVSSWDEIAPDYKMTFENIDTLLAAGRKHGTLGMVNSVWTDDTQMLMRMSWPGIAYGAASAWQSMPLQKSDFFLNYSTLVYPQSAASEMAQALQELNASELSLQAAFTQETQRAFWQDPFSPQTLSHLQTHREDLRQCRLHAEAAQEHLYRAQALGIPAGQLSTFLVGAQMLDYAGMKFLYALEIADTWAALPPHPTAQQLRDALGHGISSETHSRVLDLMDGISELKGPYREAWLAEYTNYRLPTALGRWDAEYQYWRRSQVNLNDFLSDFKTGDALPPLQSFFNTNTLAK
jgi:hexosaminidase